VARASGASICAADGRQRLDVRTEWSEKRRCSPAPNLTLHPLETFRTGETPAHPGLPPGEGCHGDLFAGGTPAPWDRRRPACNQRPSRGQPLLFPDGTPNGSGCRRDASAPRNAVLTDRTPGRRLRPRRRRTDAGRDASAPRNAVLTDRTPVRRWLPRRRRTDVGGTPVAPRIRCFGAIPATLEATNRGTRPRVGVPQGAGA
jgi:hypothetical protein